MAIFLEKNMSHFDRHSACNIHFNASDVVLNLIVFVFKKNRSLFYLYSFHLNFLLWKLCVKYFHKCKHEHVCMQDFCNVIIFICWNTETLQQIISGIVLVFYLVFKMLAHAHWKFCVHILFTFGQPQAHYYMSFNFDTLEPKIVKWIYKREEKKMI